MAAPFGRGPVQIAYHDFVARVTPTLDAAAYSAGDLLFDATEVPDILRDGGGIAVLQSVTVIDKADQGTPFALVLATEAVDFGALNEAPALDGDGVALVQGYVNIGASDYVDVGGAKVACVRGIGLGIKASATATGIWVAGINGSGAPTYAAGDLVLQLGFTQF
jgi:hypothetical protein